MDENSDLETDEDISDDGSDCGSVIMEDEVPATFAGETMMDSMAFDGIQHTRGQMNNSYIPPSLNSPPDFTPLVSPYQPHTVRLQGNLPSTFDRKSPLAFFKLFCSDTEFETFATNTNAYAAFKGAISHRPAHKRRLPWEPKSPRPWRPTTAKELMVWVALVIFMGLVKTGAKNSRIDVYWRTDSHVVFAPMKHLGLVRFQQLKRYFHLAAPNPPKNTPWFAKIEPFSNALRVASMRYLVPPTELSIDEMMVRFTGRSLHTIKIKNKPIKQGYKLFALCWRGFTWFFLYSSRTTKIGEVKKLPEHSLTSSAVIHLAKTLPYSTYRFDLYMDNYFTNIPLFSYLRNTLGIGACGTTRQGSKKFPSAFSKMKASRDPRPVWNTLAGEVIDEVLALIWMDNNYVLLLTTIHKVKGAESYIWRSRRRPGVTSTNAKVVRPIFGGQHTRMLLIPVLIDMYNHFMGGVDIADQRRSYWPTQLRVSRTWLPLFFWCLDTAIVNAFILYRIVNITAGELAKTLLDHRQFRETLYLELLNEGSPSLRRSFTPTANIITRRRRHASNSTLPATRLHPGVHLKTKEKNGRKGYCSYCCWLRGLERHQAIDQVKTVNRKFVTVLENGTIQRAYLFNNVPGGLGKKPAQTRTYCEFCKTFLCSICFDSYHALNPYPTM